MSEPRHIRIRAGVRKLPKVPFPDIPAGQTRRGAITTQKVEVTHSPKIRVVKGYVTLSQLAEKRKIQSQLARLWVKKAGIKKPSGNRWMWKEGSRELARVCKALELTGG